MSTATFTYGEQPTVMITTPDEEMRAKFASRAPAAGWRVLEACSAAEALLQLDARSCRALIIDHSLPDLHAAELAQMVRSEHSTVDVCMVDSVTEMIQRDARPCRPETERLLQALSSEPGEQAANTSEAGFEPLPKIVGTSACVRRVTRLVRLVAPRNTTVLITGASGTGKELVARAIHDLSLRASGPFVVVSCAAIPETLIEAELFGYARGAFTGAVQSRMGRVHAAHGGTLFLDEISELPLGMQAKLLRFLQNGEIQRLGCSDVFRVDVRVVAASNCPLPQRVKPAHSATTCITGLLFSHLTFRRCAREARTWRCWRCTFSRLCVMQVQYPGSASVRKRWRCCVSTLGRGTYANCNM